MRITISKSYRAAQLDGFSSIYWFSFMQSAYKPIRFISRVGAPLKRVR